MSDRTPARVERAMAELRADLAVQCCLRAESIIAGYSLDLPRLTLIARHPDQPEGYVVVTNEPDADALAAAFAQVHRPVYAIPIGTALAAPHTGGSHEQG